MLRRVLATAAALLVAVAVTGCGGSSEPSGGGGPTAQLFAERCGGCHALSAAGTRGGQGPSLDGTDADAAAVAAKVRAGGGGMPAFRSDLSPEQIGSLADYVVDERE